MGSCLEHEWMTGCLRAQVELHPPIPWAGVAVLVAEGVLEGVRVGEVEGVGVGVAVSVAVRAAHKSLDKDAHHTFGVQCFTSAN